MTASPGAAGVHVCPSCDHPWTAHGPDGCAYAEPGGCWCANTGTDSLPAPSYSRTSDTARRLVEQVLHLCQHGERAPGSGPWPADTWPEWARRAEAWLRAEPVPEPVDVDRLVTEELVQQVARALSTCATGRGYRLHDERFHLARAALSSAAADLYERGREDGRGDLIWHEERVRRECAGELRDFAREHTGRRTFRDEDDNLDYIDRYASQESLYALAAEWAGQEET